MEMSTIIVLAIAVFIIVYRIKTWNDVNVLDTESEIVEEVVEYKVEDSTVTMAKTAKTEVKVTAEKPKKMEKAAGKSETIKQKPYKKTLKADLAKNQVLAEALSNTLGDQLVFEIKSQPKVGTTTLISLVSSFTKDERAVGLIYEIEDARVTIMKSFDVKMQANEQFKVATSFSKSLTVKKDDMLSQKVDATHLFVSDELSVAVEDVILTLK